jgi:hypothetical protein
MSSLIPWNDIAFEEIETATLRSLRAGKQAPYLKRHLLAPIQEAAKLGGSALAVYLALQHRLDVTRQSSVTLSHSLLETWGIVSRTAKSRALQRLEDHGLIVVERPRGKTAQVSLRATSQ